MLTLPRWTRYGWLGVLAVAGLAPLTARGASPAEAVASFQAALDARTDLPAERMQAVKDAVTALAADPYDAPYAVAAGLRLLYPDFETAVTALEAEEFTAASESLAGLAAAEDAHLAAEASFLAGRCLMLNEQLDQAVPFLRDVCEKHAERSPHVGEARFLLGACQSSLLQRTDAIATLEKFLEEAPDAPERMRVAAAREIERLKIVEDESLADAYERMEFSRRRLSTSRTDEPTQEQQQKIVDILAKLIEKAEEQEAQGQGQGQGQGEGEGQEQAAGEGQGQGQGQAQGGSNPGGGSSQEQPGDVVRRTFRAGPRSPWDQLRDRDRDPAFSAIKENFPARYTRLVEQYYKSFQDESP